MMPQAKISTNDEITLVTLQNCSSKLSFITQVFQRISELGVNVDMIALSPTHGPTTSVSFTIGDEDLVGLLAYTSELQENFKVKTIVSSGNYKISVWDPAMKTMPGIAAQIFAAAASVDTDIRIITTSDIEISLLITAADFDQTLQAIEAVVNATA